MSEAIRLLLIDHQTLLRRCLAAILNRKHCFQVVGDIATGCEALSLARSQRPDIIVIDPDTPQSGPELIELLCEELPDSVVVVLSSGDDDVAKQALLAGARGCAEKSCEPEDLVRTIKLARAGELAIAPRMVDVILQSLNGPPPFDVPNGLTKRELEVLPLVVGGRTNPEIARELFITEHTVKGHLAKILSKLDLNNRVQLATYAVQHDLVASPEAPEPGPR